MGGRVSDFAVAEKDLYTIYVGLGTGGVFKTKNNGTTWQPIFEKQSVASVGAVAVSQTNPKTVWVGTGEANSRNSSSWGNGIYKSADEGETWKNMGLSETHDIARVAIDPKNDDVVYVAALGHLWGPNKERGVYKTSDGGKSWSPVLLVDERTGAIDVVIDPSNSSTVYAALWARQRSPYSFVSGGSTGGIFKSTDAGKTWKKLTDGLPAETSRIGLDICRKNPKVLYAVVETDLGGGGSLSEVRSRLGGVFRTEDGGAHWKRVADIAPRGFYFGKVRVDPNDPDRIYVLGFGVAVSDDGGKTFVNTGARDIHGDCHAMWIDPGNSNHVLLGTDGGIYFSYDKTKTWDFQNTIAIGEFYNVSYGMDRPYTICGGLQDNGTWCGPSATRRQTQGFSPEERRKASGITNADWIDVNGGDGFWSAIDPTNANVIYAESQGGHVNRIDLSTGKRKSIQPEAKEGTPSFRYNWNTPFGISHHDPKTLYLGGNVLFKLTDRGDKWEIISPDLTTHDFAKMATAGSNAENYCTIVAISESPKDRNVLWVGTDDGNIQVTRDGGKSWTNVGNNISAITGNLWVSRLEASHSDPARAYVAIDGHRSDIFHPYLFVTEDFGKSWTSLAAGLPDGGPIKALREDPVNPSLLFVGTEFGLFLTLDRGTHWTPMKGLPTVAVDDIQIHPRDHDLIVGTHGRSIYVLDDISALEQLDPEKLESEAVLFVPRPATEFYYNLIGGLWGARVFKAKNPPFGAAIDYYLKDYSTQEIKITIEDSKGRKIRELEGTSNPGINRATWDLQPDPSDALERGGGGPGDRGQPRYVQPGEYTVRFAQGEKFKAKTKVQVDALPGVHEGEFAAP